MRILCFILLFVLSTSHAATILDSVLTKVGNVEVKQVTEETDPAIYVAEKKVHQFDRSSITIYAVFRTDGSYGNELVIIRDCGASVCDFRIVAIDKHKKIKITNEFGNG